MQLPIKYSTGRYRPAGIPRINWANPVTNGMTACFILGENATSTIDLVRGGTYRSTGANITRQNTQDGAAVATSSLSSSGIYVTGSNVSPASAVSVFARVFTNSTQAGANRFIFTNQNVDSGSTHGYCIAYLDGTGLVFDTGNGTTFSNCVFSSSLAANTAYSVLGTYDGVNQRAYFNGALANTAAFAGSLTYTRSPILFNYDNEDLAIIINKLAKQSIWMQIHMIFSYTLKMRYLRFFLLPATMWDLGQRPLLTLEVL